MLKTCMLLKAHADACMSPIHAMRTLLLRVQHLHTQHASMYAQRQAIAHLCHSMLSSNPSLHHDRCKLSHPSVETLCAPICVQGMCASPLPVGVAGYIASKLPPQTRPSPASKHHAYPETPDPRPLGSQASTQGTLTPSRAGPDSHTAAANKQNQQEQVGRGPLRQLGIHANAAWHHTPDLAGCGPLLPSWRQVADLLVPLLHRVGYCLTEPLIKLCHYVHAA